MTGADPGGEGLAAALIQLAAHAEQIGGLDAREAEHHQDIAARLTQMTGTSDGAQYQPVPPPRWWKLTGAEREHAVDRLAAWVDQIYRPGYGRLAAALPECWREHPVCLYILDWLSELWSVLYLNADRNPAALGAQAEWQTRLLPAAVDQMTVEAGSCAHHIRPRRSP